MDLILSHLQELAWSILNDEKRGKEIIFRSCSDASAQDDIATCLKVILKFQEQLISEINDKEEQRLSNLSEQRGSSQLDVFIEQMKSSIIILKISVLQSIIGDPSMVLHNSDKWKERPRYSADTMELISHVLNTESIGSGGFFFPYLYDYDIIWRPAGWIDVDNQFSKCLLDVQYFSNLLSEDSGSHKYGLNISHQCCLIAKQVWEELKRQCKHSGVTDNLSSRYIKLWKLFNDQWQVVEDCVKGDYVYTPFNVIEENHAISFFKDCDLRNSEAVNFLSQYTQHYIRIQEEKAEKVSAYIHAAFTDLVALSKKISCSYELGGYLRLSLKNKEDSLDLIVQCLLDETFCLTDECMESNDLLLRLLSESIDIAFYRAHASGVRESTDLFLRRVWRLIDNSSIADVQLIQFCQESLSLLFRSPEYKSSFERFFSIVSLISSLEKQCTVLMHSLKIIMSEKYRTNLEIVEMLTKSVSPDRWAQIAYIPLAGNEKLPTVVSVFIHQCFESISKSRNPSEHARAVLDFLKIMSESKTGLARESFLLFGFDLLDQLRGVYLKSLAENPETKLHTANGLFQLFKYLWRSGHIIDLINMSWLSNPTLYLLEHHSDFTQSLMSKVIDPLKERLASFSSLSATEQIIKGLGECSKALMPILANPAKSSEAFILARDISYFLLDLSRESTRHRDKICLLFAQSVVRWSGSLTVQTLLLPCLIGRDQY